MKQRLQTVLRNWGGRYGLGVVVLYLTGISLLTCCFRLPLGRHLFLVHAGYVMVILAVLWYRAKGFVVAAFLAVLLLFAQWQFGTDEMIFTDYAEAGMFLGVGIFAAIVGEHNWRNRKLLAKAHRDLEQKVEIRTAELSNANEVLRQEITERKLAEQRYKTLVTTSPDAVTVSDLQGRITEVSQRTMELHGATDPDELIGKDAFELIAPEDRERAMANLQKTLKGKVERNVEYTLIKKDGSRFIGELNSALIEDAHGQPKAFIATVRDITERKRTEKERQQHLAEMARAWHINTIGEMASGLAHELNQPLCAILNYSNGCLRLLRRRSGDPEKLRVAVRQIATQAQRAGETIKRIRSLVAKHEPDQSSVNLNNLVLEVVALVKADAAKSNIEICSCLTEFLSPIHADKVGILQVILNLVRNAMESVSSSKRRRREVIVSTAMTEYGEIEVTVSDTGKGLTDDVRGKMFESFFTTKKGGLGIGLSLSRRIVEAHGGCLWAESDSSSQGATFKFTLPQEGIENGQRKSHSLCCR
jgi:PAS domain S-box-containing protein